MKLLKTTNRLAAVLVLNTIALAALITLSAPAQAMSPGTSATLAAALARSLPAPPMSPLELPIDLTGGITHAFGTAGPGGPTSATDRLVANYGSFTTDLGSLSAITWQDTAPGGAKYVVSLPAGKTAKFEIGLDFVNAAGPWGATESHSRTFSFLGVEGIAPVPTSIMAYGRTSGNQIVFGALFDVPGSFSFTGFDLNIDGPFSSGGELRFTNSHSAIEFTCEIDTDPGQFVTVIPEPATVSLLCLGGLALLRRKRVG